MFDRGLLAPVLFDPLWQFQDDATTDKLEFSKSFHFFQVGDLCNQVYVL